MKNIFLIFIFTTTLGAFSQNAGKFTDTRDGKTYKTIKIGTQTWMAENLAFKVSSGCWAYANNESNVKIYGYLYDWQTANSIVPAGWHLPDDNEWETLINYLADDNKDVAKSKMRAGSGWIQNSNCNNESGFTALPGGALHFTDEFFSLGESGHWWSSEGFKTAHLLDKDDYGQWGEEEPLASSIQIYSSGVNICIPASNKVFNGLSVRCIKD